MGTRNQKRRESDLHSELEALCWAMKSIHDTDDRGAACMADSLEKVEEIQEPKTRFHDVLHSSTTE
uniref:Uncharacterized protein n=1 Tax=Brassica oleracea TaxID=3712 RepID=A0A3P6B555_BRAOL|nr:unnamed protein product [Brassica oleracea]